jgi:hypothetical protein
MARLARPPRAFSPTPDAARPLQPINRTIVGAIRRNPDDAQNRYQQLQSGGAVVVYGVHSGRRHGQCETL